MVMVIFPDTDARTDGRSDIHVTTNIFWIDGLPCYGAPLAGPLLITYLA